MEERITWIIHRVVDDETAYCNSHTHGLDEYGSLELEINFPLPQEVAGQILNQIGLDIIDGKEIESGDHSDEYLSGGYDIYFLKTTSVNATISDPIVLRIIIPDIENMFPWDKGCEDFYRKQMNGVEILEMTKALSEKDQ